MQCTFDHRSVAHWLKVCGRLVQWTANVEPQRFREVIGKLASETGDYTSLHLLVDVGCGPETLVHFMDKRDSILL